MRAALKRLFTHPIHLGLGATAEAQDAFSGSMTLHQEMAAWHTADIDGETTALFITAGMGTEHRPR